VPAIPTQFTGPQRTQSPLSRQPFASPLSTQSTGSDWLITPQEKAHFDSIFATVDTARAGSISGDQAVLFFTNAQLPEDVLAQIWDLADIDADGQLTKDEFAVAMYLVRLQRIRKEPLPSVLPPALIPPSMRRQVTARPVQSPVSAPVPAPAPAAPAPALAPAPRSAAEDLFGLDAFSTPAPAAPAQFPQSTGGSNAPFQSPGSPASRTSQQAPATAFKPFIPSSHFGQSLNPQLTGVGATAKSPPPPSDDLLGDNDPEESKKLTQETTELANLSNQIGSLAKEMQNVQTKRASTEQEFSQTSQQKRDFEARLAQARTMYEKEVKGFKTLEERLNASRAETRKLQQEFALIEGSRQDLRNQYDQVSAALAADQSENAALKEKIRQVNAEVNQLKPALEKARSEARQQKGLVAINKKQLATVEGERDRIQGEIDTLVKEEHEAEESPIPVASSADVSSPALSTASQHTNPFFRRTTTGSSERTLSPSANQQSAFDNLFGPAFARPSTSTPPPPTSFASPSVQQTRDASKSPDTSGIPTPSVSPPPSTGPFSTSEPPPPPLSRQITPTFLPLRNEVQAPSATSSTAVSPPASRFGAPDASDAGTPLRSISNAVSANTPNDNLAVRSPFDELPEPIAAEENHTPASPSQEDVKPPFPTVPGVIPTETLTGDEGPSAPVKDPSFDELFGNVGRERSQSQKANDFEEAFAGMKPRTTAEGNEANGDSEFPPIREFDIDDDDESTDSGAPLGFDDNFAPSSPPNKVDHSKGESIDAAQLQAFPVPGSGSAPAPPPPADAQGSPPKYDQAADPGGFPPEFDGLVPSRADPTLAPDASHAVESSTGAPIVAGEAQRKISPPDFDAAFAGLNLAPAKEEDDSSDDEEAESQFSKQPNEFDFSFDSPSQPPKAGTASPGQPGASSTAASEFFSFDNSVHPSAVEAQSTTQPSAGSNTQHDWDTIFAPLGGVKAPEGESNGTANGTANTSESKGSERRPPGWALDADTGEDDLILQRLTGMGYPREESLAALEKFDYNIDKVRESHAVKRS
jgi:epidermal growth factor receptor substrate 15